MALQMGGGGGAMMNMNAPMPMQAMPNMQTMPAFEAPPSRSSARCAHRTGTERTKMGAATMVIMAEMMGAVEAVVVAVAVAVV